MSSQLKQATVIADSLPVDSSQMGENRNQSLFLI